MKNTLNQSTPAKATAPSTPFTNNTQTIEDIPGLVQQVVQALPEDCHLLQSIPQPRDQSPTSE